MSKSRLLKTKLKNHKKQSEESYKLLKFMMEYKYEKK